MATTKIWDVRGRLDHVIDYAKNPEKTENQDYSKADLQGLRDVMNYAVNDFKTEQQQYVTGLNCNPETARQEMLITKKQYRKEGGIIAYHGYQSFAYGEVTPDTAHEIGVKLAENLWGERFEVLVATHLDKKHIHNHFVLNSVSFRDGKRYYDNKATYAKMRELSDQLCKEYALSVIENPGRGKQRSYDVYLAEQQDKPTWHGIIASDIEEAIQSSRTMRQFYQQLEKKGYELKQGTKYFTLRPAGKERFVRIERKFPEFSIENIRKRILEQPGYPGRYLKITETKTFKVKIQGTPKRKIGGFRGLYLHYCYLLGVFDRKRGQQQKHFVVKEDVRKLEKISREMRFLCKEKIDTKEQLLSVKEELQEKVSDSVKERKKLRNRLRSCDNVTEQEECREQIQELSQMVKEMRKELSLCDGILKRSEMIKEKLAVVREKQPSGKEEKNHEHIR